VTKKVIKNSIENKESKVTIENNNNDNLLLFYIILKQTLILFNFFNNINLNKLELSIYFHPFLNNITIKNILKYIFKRI